MCCASGNFKINKGYTTKVSWLELLLKHSLWHLICRLIKKWKKVSIHVGIESESIWKVLATVLLHRGVSCRSRRLKPPFTSKYIGQFLHKCAIKTQLRLWFCLRVLFSGFYCNFQHKLIFPNVLKLKKYTDVFMRLCSCVIKDLKINE